MASEHWDVERVAHDGGQVELRLSGQLGLAQAAKVTERLESSIGDGSGGVLIDLSRLDELDGACASLLHAFRSARETLGQNAAFVGAKGGVATILNLYDDAKARPCEREDPTRRSAIEHVGNTTALILSFMQNAMEFVGQFVVACLRAVRQPKSVRWADLGSLCERVGADAVPIVSLIAFLIGLVTAFQAADTFRQYGANIFVADMVGLSMTRIMGPLMMAILVTGRSGAGFAAELGTMKVSEEIDALRTLGFDPMAFLVIPRVVALVLMVPLLTLIADLMGIIGGLLIALTALDLSFTAFMNRLGEAIDLWDIGTGLIMSLAFGTAIGMIACERGLSTSGGAEGVGRSTTSAVVTILFHLVILASVFTILFTTWGI